MGVLRISDLPKSVQYSYCGQTVSKDLALFERFECLAASALHGTVAAAQNDGFDVHESELFPELAFQVKVSQPSVRDYAEHDIGGRKVSIEDHQFWAWGEHTLPQADWYLLFGIREGIVYPFLMHRSDWLEHSSRMSETGRILHITAREYSHCGRYDCSVKRNKHWQYLVRSWPNGLLERIEYGHIETEQPELFAAV